MSRLVDRVHWRAGNLMLACKRRHPSPTELVTFKHRWMLVSTALSPLRRHPRNCLCYGCYL